MIRFLLFRWFCIFGLDDLAFAGLVGAGTSLLGGALSNKSAASLNNQNIELQRQFAQNGIRWRVADAKAAGLHPLYALGASTTGFSPVSAVGQMGQSVADAGRTFADYTKAKVVQAAQLDVMASEAEKNRAQSRYYDRLAVPGQGDAATAGTQVIDTKTKEGQERVEKMAGVIELKPSEQRTHQPGLPMLEAGEGPLFTRRVVATHSDGTPIYAYSINQQDADSYGDLAAPVIAAAATTYMYLTKSVPHTVRLNVRALMDWWERTGKHTEFGRLVTSRGRHGHSAPGYREKIRPGAVPSFDERVAP